ncbi:DUF2459 domain-containing protein [Desulfogranum marinum]|uniref:DUF2459 domain-containing protein n=1 Tax=Desulfogranum marinum TaxID=453220 RepID=UPI0019637992|nr:DUF2459 domain-containing protein [Desulfogranum marinum]
MRKLLAKVLPFVIVILVNGCAVQPNALFPPQEDEEKKIIFLVNHGWHAGIVVKRSDIMHSDWPKTDVFADMDYVEIGWGDRAYYTSPDPGSGLAAKALLLPTSSVVHLVGFRGQPENYFPYSEIVKLQLSVPGFEKMIRCISKSFSRDKSGSAVALGHGNYGTSQFYASEETYHLFKTCNTWTETILQSAGCPVNSSITVNGLMSQVRRFGEVIQVKSEPR